MPIGSAMVGIASTRRTFEVSGPQVGPMQPARRFVEPRARGIERETRERMAQAAGAPVDALKRAGWSRTVRGVKRRALNDPPLAVADLDRRKGQVRASSRLVDVELSLRRQCVAELMKTS